MSVRRVVATERKGIFDTWQPRYAERGIATFPVRFIPDGNGKINKVPAVQHYMKFGLRGSTELTRKFADADGIGFALGNRNKIAVVDVDTPDENMVSNVLDYYGQSPLIARSPSGGHHVYYKHNGQQRRRIRDPYWRERGAPVDVLGNGFIVAPPSCGPKGPYQFVQGDIDDLVRLPIMRTIASPTQASPPVVQSTTVSTISSITEGRRNTELWRFCMRQAHSAANFAELLERARRFNESCWPPLEEDEMTNAVQSAWSYTEKGLNRFGQHGAWLAIEEIATMTHEQDALVLLAFLRAHNGKWATFMCANGLGETFGWHRVRMAQARRRLIELGHLKPVRQAGKGHPALFRFAP
jgi:bifunctional DNA primase/polymerase-like protein/primase-like protein